jgi:hypothetical protein
MLSLADARGKSFERIDSLRIVEALEYFRPAGLHSSCISSLLGLQNSTVVQSPRQRL